MYTHLFDHAEHAATVMERLEGRFGAMLRRAAPEAPAGQEAVATRRAPGVMTSTKIGVGKALSHARQEVSERE